MAAHCSVLAWEIPWTEEPGGYSPRVCKRIGHGLVTTTKLNTWVISLLLDKSYSEVLEVRTSQYPFEGGHYSAQDTSGLRGDV